MNIIQVTQDDFNEWLTLSMQLWSEDSLEETYAGLITILNSPHEAAFLARVNDRGEIALISVSSG